MKSDSKTLLETDRFCVERISFEGPSGKTISREVIRHPGAVVIVPMVDDDHVCLIKNYRVAIDESLVELPAGTMVPGESPLDTARRELTEETGYHAGRLEPLHSYFVSPGILDERMHLFLATELTDGLPAREPDESIENHVTPWGEAMAMVHDQRIHDAKTIVGLLYFDRLKIANDGVME